MHVCQQHMWKVKSTYKFQHQCVTLVCLMSKVLQDIHA